MKGSIKIDSSFCKGCGLCVPVCPNHLIEIGSQRNAMGYYVATSVKPAKKPEEARGCTGCTLCAIMCPEVAIEVFREKR